MCASLGREKASTTVTYLPPALDSDHPILAHLTVVPGKLTARVQIARRICGLFQLFPCRSNKPGEAVVGWPSTSVTSPLTMMYR